jgi:hypothetical protein
MKVTGSFLNARLTNLNGMAFLLLSSVNETPPSSANVTWGMITSDEMERMSKETVVTYYKALYNHFPRGAEKTYDVTVSDS